MDKFQEAKAKEAQRARMHPLLRKEYASQDEDITGWITRGGQHIPIKGGDKSAGGKGESQPGRDEIPERAAGVKVSGVEAKLKAQGYKRSKAEGKGEYVYQWKKEGSPSYTVNYRTSGETGKEEIWKD